MLDAVCIGAHPDDVEIGMGGTVAGMTRAGLRVGIVDLTNGEPTPHGTPELRASEAAQAASTLGVERVTLDLPNRYLFDSVEARTAVAEVLRELRPKVVFAPYPEDAHPDHIAASRIVTAARFYSKFTKTDMRGEPHHPARVYHYMAVHLRLVREPSFVIDISADLGTKLAALGCYRSQFVDNERNSGIIGEMERIAAWWGSRIGTGAGEPFFSAEPLGFSSIQPLL